MVVLRTLSRCGEVACFERVVGWEKVRLMFLLCTKCNITFKA